jgi:hypothetical protein
MDVTIIVAIVSAASAIVIAIYSAITSARSQRKHSLELENLKFELEEKKAGNERARKDADEIDTLINRSLEYSQKIKDNISIISKLLPLNDGQDIEHLKKTLSLVDEYNELYSKVFQKGHSPLVTSLHDLKAALTNLYKTASSLIKQIEKKEDIDSRVISGQLLHIRQKISEHQEEIMVQKLIRL